MSESSSDDSPLGRAIRQCSAGPALDGIGYSALVAPVRPRRRWQQAKAANASRKRELHSGFFKSTQKLLGRHAHQDFRRRQRREGKVGVRKAGAYTDSYIADLAFPPTDSLASDKANARDLSNTRVTAARMGADKMTVHRARSLCANALGCEVESQVTARSEAAPLSTIAQKLSWDETSLHFSNPRRVTQVMSPELVETFCPQAFRNVEAEEELREAGTRSHREPAVVMNVMQASTHVMLDNFSAEILSGPRLVRNTQAEEILSALSPLFRDDLLKKAAEPDERAASKIAGLYADSARSNKLVVTELADKVDCPVVDGVCLAHQISIACQETGKGGKSEISVETAMHATHKLMALLLPRQAVLKKLTSMAKKARVYRGVAPPDSGREFARKVYDVVKPTEQQQVDDIANHEQEDARGLVYEMFNGDWTQPVWEHYCCRNGAADRRPCCRSIDQSRWKMRMRMHAALSKSQLLKTKDGTKKWGESMSACRTYSFFTQCHDTWGQAIQVWDSRGGDGGDGGSSESEHRDDALPLRNRKRKKKAVKFWNKKGTKRLVTSLALISRPLMNVLYAIYHVEKLARLRTAAQVDVAGPSLLGGKFLAADGFFAAAEAELEQLLAPTSGLLHESCTHDAADVAESRAALLRAMASLKFRILDRTRRKGSFYDCVAAVDANTQECAEAFCSSLARQSK